MSEPNYAGNIIVNLASLPDFLRKPILKKRMMEFFSMDQAEKDVVINNAKYVSKIPSKLKLIKF